MTATEILGLVATCIGVVSFATVIRVLYRNYIKAAIREIESGKRDIEIIDSMIYESDPKVAKSKKANQVTKTVLYYAFLTLAIPLFGFAVYSKATNGVTMIGDNAVLVVGSSSMSVKAEGNDYLYTYNLNDQFQTYDLITVTKAHYVSEIRQYDVIAFRNDKGVNIIHRVISVSNEGGDVSYVTRGDANAASDAYKPTFEDVIGVYRGKRIKGIGAVISFFQDWAGIITVASVVFCLLMLDFLNRKHEEAIALREEMLSGVFDLSKMGQDAYKEMAESYSQAIYYQGYRYSFGEHGFLGKREMSQDEKKEFDEASKANEAIGASENTTKDGTQSPSKKGESK